ncbi:unnamed protein product [Strongylus vulgaris]|uniref:Uncharacterized protein n=1 Tax=Strongylus vulgaris TaxID=40348 RepID=A0A3P7JGX2_STRVU|nr:unnamed protein product [Strongylus vulgaris]
MTDPELRAHLSIQPFSLRVMQQRRGHCGYEGTIRRALERCLFKYNRRIQLLIDVRSSDMRSLSRDYVSKANH